MFYNKICHPVLAALLLAAPLTTARAVLSIGHRGDSLFAPENTVAAFKSALSKADFVELDTYVCVDGTIAVMHDSNVDRTTDGTGSVTAMTRAQLKALDAGSWFAPSFAGERVPTLEDAITNVVPHAKILLERKGGSAEAHVAELRRLNALTNVLVQSFDWNFLAAVHALEPTLNLGALGSGAFTSATLASIINSGCGMVAWEKGGVNPAMVQMVHNAGLQLFVWTVDGVEIQNFIDLGVDGVISNDPGMVRKLQLPPDPATAANLAADLLMYWRMDNGLTNALTTTVTDHKGAGSTTLTRLDALSHWGGPAEAMFGGCVQLDANAFIPVPVSPATEIDTNAFTFSAWVKLDALPTQLPTPYGSILDSTNDCYSIYLDRSNKELRFKVTDNNNHAARPGIPESKLVANTWLHVAGVYSGAVGPVSGQATIYLNGRPADVHTGNDGGGGRGLTGTVKTAAYAALGREGVLGGNPFPGSLDDVAIWRRALDAAEIKALYEGGLRGQSLADLTREPTNLLRARALRLLPGTSQMEVEFQSFGTFKGYRLLRAPALDGPFLPIYGSTAVSLGRGLWRFTLPHTNSATGDYYRIEGE